MYILYVLAIFSGGMSDVSKVPFQDRVACERQAKDLNDHIAIGSRFYSFCYDAKEETR